jgi:hypothetical protein
MNRFNWIKNHLEQRAKGISFNCASDIIPNMFDEYFLIHWNIGIVDKFPFELYPENNETIEDTNSRIRIEKEYGLFLNPNSENLFRQTTLKEVAKKFNVEYDYEVLSNIKRTPAIKILSEISLKNLRNGISSIVNNQALNLYVEDFYRYHTDEKVSNEFIDINLNDYFKWQNNFGFDFCTYLFPEERNWCITTFEDMDMLLCIKKELSTQIVDTFKVEFFEIGYEQKLN